MPRGTTFDPSTEVGRRHAVGSRHKPHSRGVVHCFRGRDHGLLFILLSSSVTPLAYFLDNPITFRNRLVDLLLLIVSNLSRFSTTRICSFQ